MKTVGARQTGCELFAALMKRDQTRDELMASSGVSEGALDGWLREMRASGIVYRRQDMRKTGQGNHRILFCLQSRPFEQVDEL